MVAILLLPPFTVSSQYSYSTIGCVRLGEPVLTPGPSGSWDDSSVGYQTVLSNGTGYLMWYTGFGSNSSSTGWAAIGYASSLDGINWIRQPGPVLGPGAAGSWDSLQVYRPSVVWNGSNFLMYFTGVSSGPSPVSIGLAISKDGIHWREYPGNPILGPGPEFYDIKSIKAPSVIYNGHSYRMWYDGRMSNNSYTINLATSDDGILWTKYGGNPVLSKQDFVSQQSLGPRNPSATVQDLGYLMAFYYAGNITYAISSDGLHWHPRNAPLISNVGNQSNADMPSIVNHGGVLFVWFIDLPPKGFPAPSGTTIVDFAICGPHVLQTTTVVMNTTLMVTATSTSFFNLTTTQFLAASGPQTVEVLSVSAAVLLVAVLVLAIALFRSRSVR